MAKTKITISKTKKKLKMTKKPLKKSFKPKLSKLTKKTKQETVLEPQNSDSEIEEFMDKPANSDEELSNDESHASDSEAELDEEALAAKHKKDLEKLKETDPEFYKFLQVTEIDFAYTLHISFGNKLKRIIHIFLSYLLPFEVHLMLWVGFFQ